MCGVVGYVPVDPGPEVPDAFARLFHESCIRGLHAYGVANIKGRAISVTRAFEAAQVAHRFDPALPTIAHARYSTSGDWQTLANNQPIVVGTTALAFNGVISMSTKPEFEAEFGVTCEADNDGEVFLRRLDAGESAVAFLARIRGSFAGVWLADGRLYAARNARRPLWRGLAYGARWYASTADIFRRAGFQSADLVPPLMLQEGW